MIPRAASVAAWRGHPRPLCSHARGLANDAQGKRRYRHETQGGAPRTTSTHRRRTRGHMGSAAPLPSLPPPPPPPPAPQTE